MRLQFLFELAITLAFPEQSLQFGKEDAQHPVHPCFSSRRTRPITPAMRSQFSVSTASCFMPTLVIENVCEG